MSKSMAATQLYNQAKTLQWILCFFHSRETLHSTGVHIWSDIENYKSHCAAPRRISLVQRKAIGRNSCRVFHFRTPLILIRGGPRCVAGTDPAIVVRRQGTLCCETNNSQLRRRRESECESSRAANFPAMHACMFFSGPWRRSQSTWREPTQAGGQNVRTPRGVGQRNRGNGGHPADEHSSAFSFTKYRAGSLGCRNRPFQRR